LDKQLFRINDDWALAYDSNQWILQKRRGSKWRGIAFIGGKKATLNRILMENDVVPTENAWDTLKSLPDTFLEWRDQADLRMAAE